MPPLRDRRCRIPPSPPPSIEANRVKFGQPRLKLSKRADRCSLLARQRARTREQAQPRVDHADASQITSDDLGLKAMADEEGENPFDLRAARDAAEKRTIIAALGRANGNIAKAAELLGISRPTLYDLMHRLSLK